MSYEPPTPPAALPTDIVDTLNGYSPSHHTQKRTVGLTTDKLPTSAGWETILTNLYDVVYTTLQYAGLIVLVLGLIVWLTARRNS